MTNDFVAEIGAMHHPFKVGSVRCTWVRVPPGSLTKLNVVGSLLFRKATVSKLQTGNIGCWNTQESVKLPLRHVGSSPTIPTMFH